MAARHAAARMLTRPAEAGWLTAHSSRSTTSRRSSTPAAARCRRSTTSASRSIPARRSAWSASRAAASRSRPCRSCAWCSRPAASPRGSIRFKGRDLLTLDEPAMRAVRGADISLIFQEPMTALNPVFTVGDQIAETLLVHRPRHAPRGEGSGGRAAEGGADSRSRPPASRITRISSPAACASAS